MQALPQTRLMPSRSSPENRTSVPLRTPQYHVHDTNDSTVAWHRGKSRLLNSASRIRGIASNFRQKKNHLSTGVLSSCQLTKLVPRGFRGVPGLQQSPGLPRVPNTRLLIAPYTAVMTSHGSAPVESTAKYGPSPTQAKFLNPVRGFYYNIKRRCFGDPRESRVCETGLSSLVSELVKSSTVAVKGPQALAAPHQDPVRMRI